MDCDNIRLAFYAFFMGFEICETRHFRSLGSLLSGCKSSLCAVVPENIHTSLMEEVFS